MIYIAAQSVDRAANVAGRMGLRREQWKYISERHDLHGVDRGACVLLVEGFFHNPRADEIMMCLNQLKAWTWRELDLGR